MAARGRVLKEIHEQMQVPFPLIHFTFNDDDIYSWHVKIEGADDTPYEGGIFQLYIPIN